MTTKIEQAWDRLEDATMRHDISLEIDGSFEATISADATPDIRVRRHLHLDRDHGSQWVVYSDPTMEANGDVSDFDAPVAKIRVTDPEIIRFLDSLYRMIADPENYRSRMFGPPLAQDAA